MPETVAEVPTASQLISRGCQGRRRNVSQPARNTKKLSAMPHAVCSFQNGKLLMGSPGGYFTARWSASISPQ